MRFLQRALELDPHKRFDDAQRMSAAFARLLARSQVLATARRRRRRTAKSPTDWAQLRQREVLRHDRTALQLHDECGRCKGPISEAMFACPWCGNARPRHRGETRHPARCGRCGRGRKLDWRFCAYCYGAGFARVAPRQYSDRTYTERCGNPSCERKLLMPWSRYCPWCHRKVKQRWKVPGSKHRCSRCGWGVHRDLWHFCPWCGKKIKWDEWDREA